MTFTQRRLGSTLLIVGLGLASASLPAQTDINFAITDPVYGVLALNDSTKTFASAANNPTSANVNGASASMSLSGSELTFSANIGGYDGNWFQATTGVGSSDGRIGPVGVKIVGTAGEDSRTPVSITLNSVYTGEGNLFITQVANGAYYPTNASSVVSGLHVGDTFELWAGLASKDASSGTLTTTLAVNALGTSPVPEPGSLALLGGLCVMGMGLLRRKYRRNTTARMDT